MKFVRYPSIENMNRSQTINYIVEHGHSSGEWCCANKIHGANYSFWIDDDEARPAKRSGLMASDGGGFYGSHVVYARYIENIREMYRYFKAQFVFDVLVVYGEIFGGGYPHPDVEKVKNAKRVQDGVHYCPQNEFLMFDIAFYHKGELVFFLSKISVNFLGKKFDIPKIDLCHLGTFEEMLKIDPVFEDPTYTLFGLPKIEGNMSEGWVISPIETKFFHNGSRVILKNKNPAFSERKAKKERKPPEDLDPEVAFLLNEGLTYVTENRLRNVVSHGDEIANFGVLLSLIAEDVFSDFSKSFGERLLVLPKKDKKIVNKGINKEIAILIRPHFQNIIDGNF